MDAYAAVFSKLRPGVQIVPYISPEEKKALNKKLREEREEKQRKEKEARIVDATIRVFLPADQRTEIRWTEKSSLSSVPTVVSQSHPQAIIEVEFAKKPDSKCAYKVDISNLKDWDKLRKKVKNYYENNTKQTYAEWHIHPTAPKIAHEILNNLVNGNIYDVSSGVRTVHNFMSDREDPEDGFFRSWYEVATLENLDAQGLLLEYQIKLDSVDFNVGKLSFFSFKGKSVPYDDELCSNLSRQMVSNNAQMAEYRREQQEQREINDEERNRRQRGMSFFDRVIDDWVNPSAGNSILDRVDSIADSKSDDNIVWFDLINYDTQFGALLKVYRVNYDNTLEELNVKA